MTNWYKEIDDHLQDTKGTIRKVGNEWCIFSKKTNKKLGCYSTKKEAVERLRQIEIHKNG